MDKAYFNDKNGDVWKIDIAYGDIIRVKQHVQDTVGKPLDLCYIAETGDFTSVTDNINIIVQCVYWLLYPAITEQSGKNGIEAQQWFYDRLNGEAISQLIRGWYEALINFTPYPVIKSALMIAGETKTKSELIAAIDLLAGQLEDYTNTPGSCESIQGDSPTDSLQ